MLLVKIRSKEGIKGIVVDKQIKLAAFADDLTTFLHNVNSLENLSVILHRFGMCSRLKLNAEKALWLGTCNDRDQPLLVGIDKVNKPIKILAINFTYDLKKKQELNYMYAETLSSLSETLAGWKWRNLMLYGKIQVVKTFVIPNFMLRASLM